MIPSGPRSPTAAGSFFLAVLLGLLVVPATGEAQWVEEPGDGWTALAVYHQDTREFFDLSGDRRDLFAEGHAVTTSTFLTTALGLVRGVDAWLQLSFNRLSFDDLAGDRTSTGFGDTRVWLRVAPLTYVGSDFPLAVRGGVKLPVGDFDVDAEVIPLGDGQRDWEIMAEIGHSFHPSSVYVMGWAGYRWREENTTSQKDFGDEVFYFAKVGGRVGRLGWELAVDGWDGSSGVIEGISVPSAERDLVQLQPGLLYPVGPGEIGVGARFTLSGRNLPAGTAFLLSYFTSWSL